MIRNINLYNSVKETIKVVFSYYRNNIILDPLYKNDSFYLSITYSKVDKVIKNLLEFTESVKFMKLDSVISKAEGKLVGYHSSLFNIGSLEDCLLSFLLQFYKKNIELTENSIEFEYLLFESFFYNEQLMKLDSTPLYNFDCSKNEISFENGIKIQKKIFEFPKKNFDFYDIGYNVFSRSDFIITREYQTKKIIQSATERSEEKEKYYHNLREATRKEEMPNSSEHFDQIITSLRVLKSSGIYRDHKIQSILLSFSPKNDILTLVSHFENKIIGNKCELLDSEIGDLKKIYNYISIENDSRFGVSIRRLSNGMERKNIEDQLIDYMVGLETMYLPDGNTELSFRLSLRVAFSLSTIPAERKLTFEFLRKIYKIRSNIVHGKTYKLEEEEVLAVEEILRNSIKLWIMDKKNFLAIITESGVKKDGKLNSIFFE